jgi:putative endonuclease
MITNYTNTVIYTGVTNNILKRVENHKNGIGSVFSLRYNLSKLVYYEEFNNINDAIAREKQIKGGSRLKKINLIVANNVEWNDLYYDLRGI